MFWFKSSKAEELYNKGYDLYLKKNYPEAFRILTEAAKLGSGAADCSLGQMHSLGYGRPVDKERAFEHFLSGAKQGDSGSQFLLGRCYQEGTGTEQDLFEALAWFKKAAAQDNRLAPYEIVSVEKQLGLRPRSR